MDGLVIATRLMLETRERKVKEQYATKIRAETNYSYSSVHDWTCEKTKRLSNIGARATKETCYSNEERKTVTI